MHEKFRRDFANGIALIRRLIDVIPYCSPTSTAATRAMFRPARRMLLVFLNTFVLLTFDVTFAGGAEAHAIIVFAQPAMDSIVASGTIAIRLRFNSRIDVRHSRLSLERPDGTVETVTIAPEGIDNALAGQAAAAADGRWTLHWLVLSLDGHITRGEVIFFVRGTR